MIKIFSVLVQLSDISLYVFVVKTQKNYKIIKYYLIICVYFQFQG